MLEYCCYVLTAFLVLLQVQALHKAAWRLGGHPQVIIYGPHALPLGKEGLEHILFQLLVPHQDSNIKTAGLGLGSTSKRDLLIQFD